MTVPPEVQARAIVAEFQDAVDRSRRAMATALEDLLAQVQRAADTLSVRLREVAAEATRDADVPASLRRPGHPVAGGVMKRTAARRVRLQELWKVQPRVSLDDIAAELNTIKPGTDLERGDVSSWAHDLKLPRRIDRYAAPVATPVAEPRTESVRVTAQGPTQPVGTPEGLSKAAAAPVQPERPMESVRQAAPMSAPTASFGEAVFALFPSLNILSTPSVPSPAAATVAVATAPANYPKISGSSIAPPARPTDGPARPAPVPPTDPVAADETYIRDWAAQRGIVYGRKLDMAQINARRRRLGLAPFADPADNMPARAGAR